jgi:hypothetical protein
VVWAEQQPTNLTCSVNILNDRLKCFIHKGFSEFCFSDTLLFLHQKTTKKRTVLG